MVSSVRRQYVFTMKLRQTSKGPCERRGRIFLEKDGAEERPVHSRIRSNVMPPYSLGELLLCHWDPFKAQTLGGLLKVCSLERC